MSPSTRACRKEPFPFLFTAVLLLKNDLLPYFCFLRDFFLYVRRIYEHVVAEHEISTTTVPQTPQSQHSSAQRSQPARQAAKQVRADQSATTQASRRSWLALACRRAYSSLCSQNEEIEICSVYKKYCWCGVMREGFVRYTARKTFFPPFLFRPYMLRPVCFGGPWSSWHLHVASLHRKQWTSLCDSVIRILINSFV